MVGFNTPLLPPRDLRATSPTAGSRPPHLDIRRYGRSWEIYGPRIRNSSDFFAILDLEEKMIENDSKQFKLLDGMECPILSQTLIGVCSSHNIWMQVKASVAITIVRLCQNDVFWAPALLHRSLDWLSCFNPFQRNYTKRLRTKSWRSCQAADIEIANPTPKCHRNVPAPCWSLTTNK